MTDISLPVAAEEGINFIAICSITNAITDYNAQLCYYDPDAEVFAD